MNEAVKVVEFRIDLLSSKRDRLVALTSQLKAVDQDHALTYDTMTREIEWINFAISELKNCIVDLRKIR